MAMEMQTSKARTKMLVDFIIKLIYDGIIVISLNKFYLQDNQFCGKIQMLKPEESVEIWSLCIEVEW